MDRDIEGLLGETEAVLAHHLRHWAALLGSGKTTTPPAHYAHLAHCLAEAQVWLKRGTESAAEWFCPAREQVHETTTETTTETKITIQPEERPDARTHEDGRRRGRR